MPSGDVSVQSAVHSIEQGKLAIIIKGGMFATLIIGLSLLYLFVHFKGLNDPSAMDQAQIARNLAAGHGFTTRNISPMAIQKLREAGRAGGDGESIDVSRFPDFYQSPLLPWINSFALSFVKGSWKMTPADIVYVGDRMLAFTSLLFMLAGVGVWYFVFRKLFDPNLALYASAAVLVTDLLWQFSLSGLPQMLLLLLFGIAALLTLFAEDSQACGSFVPMVIQLAAAGLVFGLMILAHGLAFWIFLGWLIYAALVFRPRGLMVLGALGAAVLVVGPWMARNYQVCGNPFGLAMVGGLHDGSAFSGYLRMATEVAKPSLQGIFRRGVIAQLDTLPAFFGINLAAMVFFVAMFHRFRSETTSSFRWALVSMWVFAFIGMSFFRPEGAVSANQIHIVFLPIFIAYGFAFLFVLWGRWDFGRGLLRIVFVSAVIFACAIPMLMTLLAGPAGRVQWRPYIPPFIGILGDWFQEDEVIASDMPWAVAWYANRSSLLLPESVRDFNRMHDYQELQQPIRGLYLTPISGNQPLFSEIYKGRYREWAPLITRPPQVRGFPFAFFKPLPIDGECIIYSDRERWNQPRPTQ